MSYRDRVTDHRLKQAAKRSAEGISDSSIFLVMFSEAMLEDPLPLLQMGIAMYMDKPIYLLVPEGSTIPENLRKVAKGIEYYKHDLDDMSSIEAATQRLLNGAT